VVFTLPRHLAPLLLYNKKVLYDLLFRISAETLLGSEQEFVETQEMSGFLPGFGFS
jgi:hypothetical protein